MLFVDPGASPEFARAQRGDPRLVTRWRHRADPAYSDAGPRTILASEPSLRIELSPRTLAAIQRQETSP